MSTICQATDTRTLPHPAFAQVSKVHSAETANALELGYELPPGQLLHPWAGFPAIAVEMCAVDFEIIMLIHRY